MQDFVDDTDFNEDILTPGRQRLLNNLQKNEIDWDINQDQFFESEINVGGKVYHKKYGYGKIKKLDNDTALVDFENFSPKKIYLKFIKAY